MKLRYNIQYFIYYCAIGAIYPLLGRYLSEHLNYNGTQIGTIMALPSLVVVFALPLFGAFFDNAKRPKLVPVSLMIASTVTALAIPQFKGYAIVLVLITSLELFIKPVSVILDSMSVNASDKIGFEFGNVRKYGSMGYIAMSVVIALLTKEHSISIIFYAMAIFMVIASINIFTIKDIPNKTDSHQFIKELKLLLRNKQFFLAVSIYALIFGIANAGLSYDSIRLQDLGYGSEYMAYLVPSFVFFEVVLLKYSDRFINRFGYRTPLLLGGIVISLKWTIYIFTTNVYVYIAFASLHGLMLALVIPTIFKYIKHVVAKNVHATAMTILNSVFLLSIALFNLATGVLIEHQGFDTVFILYLVASVFGTLLTRNLRDL